MHLVPPECIASTRATAACQLVTLVLLGATIVRLYLAAVRARAELATARSAMRFWSHESKNALLGALATVDAAHGALIDSASPPDGDEAAASASGAADDVARATALLADVSSEIHTTLDDLIDTARATALAAGTYRAQPVPTDLRAMLGASARAAGCGARHALRVSVEGDLQPAHVLIDADILRHAHANALSNARKYGAPDTPIVTRAHVTLAGELRLSVTNAPGAGHTSLCSLGALGAAELLATPGSRAGFHRAHESAAVAHASAGDGGWIMATCVRVLGGAMRLEARSAEVQWALTCPAPLTLLPPRAKPVLAQPRSPCDVGAPAAAPRSPPPRAPRSPPSAAHAESDQGCPADALSRLRPRQLEKPDSADEHSPSPPARRRRHASCGADDAFCLPPHAYVLCLDDSRMQRALLERTVPDALGVPAARVLVRGKDASEIGEFGALVQRMVRAEPEAAFLVLADEHLGCPGASLRHGSAACAAPRVDEASLSGSRIIGAVRKALGPSLERRTLCVVRTAADSDEAEAYARAGLAHAVVTKGRNSASSLRAALEPLWRQRFTAADGGGARRLSSAQGSDSSGSESSSCSGSTASPNFRRRLATT